MCLIKCIVELEKTNFLEWKTFPAGSGFDLHSSITSARSRTTWEGDITTLTLLCGVIKQLFPFYSLIFRGKTGISGTTWGLLTLHLFHQVVFCSYIVWPCLLKTLWCDWRLTVQFHSLFRCFFLINVYLIQCY